MGLWFVDSFDHYDTDHIGSKYKNPDNPHPTLEFQTGLVDTLLKRTGHQSFKGKIQKWHGGTNSVRAGIAFHSSTVGVGVWVRGFGQGVGLHYTLSYDGTNLTASGFFGVIATAAITIVEGWNYLEWYFELHIYTSGDSYTHHVRLNGEDVFFDNSSETPVDAERYTIVYPEIGNVDDYYVQKSEGIHTEFLGAIRVVALRPIANGVQNDWGQFPRVHHRPSPVSVPSPPESWELVDDGFQDINRIPDDNFTYLFDNSTGEEESYKMRQIDPSIQNILGFQYNNYGVVPDARSGQAPLFRHQYYNPDVERREGGTFSYRRSTVFDTNVPFEYRTEFKEFPFGEIENGHLNNGAYINDSSFGVTISTGATPLGRMSQFYIEVVLPADVDPEPPEPVPVSVGTVKTFRFTKLWKFELKDGTIFRFTNHNIDLVNPNDGFTYTPVASLFIAATQRQTGIDPTNTEAIGAIDVLDFNSFLKGVNLGAKITEFILDWQYPWSGVITKTTFILQEVSWDAAKWSSQFSSLVKRISYPKGDVYGRTCRHVLGDLGCKVNIDLLKQTQILALPPVVGKTRFRAAVSAGLDAFGNDRGVSGYFNFGNIFWTQGNNIGLHSEIRSSILAFPEGEKGIQDFILQVPLPFLIVAGTRFTIWPGCDKLWSTCRDKFENEIDGDVGCGNTKNFGGFPTIPGKDGIFSPIREARRVFLVGEIFDDSILGDLWDFFFPGGL